MAMQGCHATFNESKREKGVPTAIHNLEDTKLLWSLVTAYVRWELLRELIRQPHMFEQISTIRPLHYDQGCTKQAISVFEFRDGNGKRSSDKVSHHPDC